MAVTIYTKAQFDNQDTQKVYQSIVNSTVPNAATVVLPVTPAGNAAFQTANTNLSTALQAALRTIPNKVVINISQGIVWDGAAFQGWANISYNP